MRRPIAFILVMLLGAGCADRGATPATDASLTGGGPPVAADTSCAPTDQARYVYRPARLEPLTACVHVTGTVMTSSTEADGDVHLQVRLDASFAALLVPGNQQHQDGNLVVEPVCQFPPPQADAIRICASDPDPLVGGLPAIGQHVWLEGRYVLDLQHYAWAELHPLYRWGPLAP